MIALLLAVERYGVYGYIVSGATSAAAAATALVALWRPRDAWYPEVGELSPDVTRVSWLIIVAGLVLLLNATRDGRHDAIAVWTLVGSLVAAVVGVGALIALKTSYMFATEPGGSVIGGFRLSGPARRAHRVEGFPLPEVFAGTGFNPAAMWTPISRVLCQLCFVVAYWLLVAGGSLVLAAVGALVAAA